MPQKSPNLQKSVTKTSFRLIYRGTIIFLRPKKMPNTTSNQNQKATITAQPLSYPRKREPSPPLTLNRSSLPNLVIPAQAPDPVPPHPEPLLAKISNIRFHIKIIKSLLIFNPCIPKFLNIFAYFLQKVDMF